MKDEFELEILPDGTIRTMYQDGIEDFAKEIGAEVSSVCRLTQVEWEEGVTEKGWTVRSEHDPRFCIRWVFDAQGERTIFKPMRLKFVNKDVVFFDTRDAALWAEQRFATEFIQDRAEFHKQLVEKWAMEEEARMERECRLNNPDPREECTCPPLICKLGKK
jgi:hypothetical protein